MPLSVTIDIFTNSGEEQGSLMAACSREEDVMMGRPGKE